MLSSWCDSVYNFDNSLEGTRLADGYMPVTSSGIQALDQYLDGFTKSTSMGLCMGSIWLVVEDNKSHRSFASVIERCFVAEGLCSGQKVVCVLGGQSKDDFKSRIPRPTGDDGPVSPIDQNVKLDIAWRYEKYDADHCARQSIKSALGRQFRLDKKLSSDRFGLLEFRDDLDGLEEWLAQLDEKGKVTRILIQSFGSPRWTPHNPPLFVYRLKRLVRDRPIVCLLTVPASIDESMLCRMTVNSDYALVLSPLDDGIEGVDGFVHFVKVDSLCASIASVPNCGEFRGSEVVYSVKNARPVVAEYNPPPEPDNAPRVGVCGADGTKNNKLDF